MKAIGWCNTELDWKEDEEAGISIYSHAECWDCSQSFSGGKYRRRCKPCQDAYDAAVATEAEAAEKYFIDSRLRILNDAERRVLMDQIAAFAVYRIRAAQKS